MKLEFIVQEELAY